MSNVEMVKGRASRIECRGERKKSVEVGVSGEDEEKGVAFGSCHSVLDTRYSTFFKNAGKPMRIMADLIRRGKPADGIMKILPQEEKRQDRIQNKGGRNDPCYCGSGIKFKKCPGVQK